MYDEHAFTLLGTFENGKYGRAVGACEEITSVKYQIKRNQRKFAK